MATTYLNSMLPPTAQPGRFRATGLAARGVVIFARQVARTEFRTWLYLPALATLFMGLGGEGSGTRSRVATPHKTALLAVYSDVTGVIGKFKVVDGVIEFVPVPMVDHFSRSKSPAKVFFHDMPMLHHLATAEYINPPITAAIDTRLSLRPRNLQLERIPIMVGFPIPSARLGHLLLLGFRLSDAAEVAASTAAWDASQNKPIPDRAATDAKLVRDSLNGQARFVLRPKPVGVAEKFVHADILLHRSRFARSA